MPFLRSPRGSETGGVGIAGGSLGQHHQRGSEREINGVHEPCFEFQQTDKNTIQKSGDSHVRSARGQRILGDEAPKEAIEDNRKEQEKDGVAPAQHDKTRTRQFSV